MLYYKYIFLNTVAVHTYTYKCIHIYITGRLGFDLHLTLCEAEQGTREHVTTAGTGREKL